MKLIWKRIRNFFTIIGLLFTVWLIIAYIVEMYLSLQIGQFKTIDMNEYELSELCLFGWKSNDFMVNEFCGDCEVNETMPFPTPSWSTWVPK